MELYYYHSNLTNAVIAMSNEKSFAGLLFTMLALCFAFFLNYLLDIFSFSKCSISEMYIASMQTKFNTYFRERLITEVGFYKPPWWYNKHLCTVFSFGADICLRYKREIFSHSDGSLFAVDWYPKRPDLNDINGSENHLKICVIVPGLGGNSDTKCISKFVWTLSSHGYFCVVVTARGVGIPLQTAKLWHPALTEDAELMLNDLHQSYGSKAKIFLAGFSAGTNILTRALQSRPADINIAGCLCVCVGGNYKETRNRIEKQFSGVIYSMMMASVIKNIISRNTHVHEQIGNKAIKRLKSLHTLSELDSFAATELYGFPSPDHYDLACPNMSADFFAKIDVPYLVIQPRDDPLHADGVRHNINVELFEKNPNTLYVEPSAGNHFGFIEGPIWEALSNLKTYTYPARVGACFFDSILQFEDNRNGMDPELKVELVSTAAS